MNINRVTISGRLGEKPELKMIEGGRQVCNTSVATNEYWNDKDGNKQTRTSWHRMTVWGKQAEWLSSNLNKGDTVFVEGKIQYDEWKDDNNSKRTSVSIVASNVQSLSINPKAATSPITTDEIPF
jgi:single-strand DNA-binding protein